MKSNTKTHLLNQSALLLTLIINISLVFSVQANTITQKIEDQEQLLGARIGVSIYDVIKKKLWSYNGNEHFPLMSTFKTLACAKLLADIENGLQSFDTSSAITTNSLID